MDQLGYFYERSGHNTIFGSGRFCFTATLLSCGFSLVLDPISRSYGDTERTRKN